MEISLLGPSTRPFALLNQWLAEKKCPQYAEIYITQGNKYGIRGDIALFQSLLETGFWSFKGDVKPEQNNFAGLGATGGGVAGDRFETPEKGIEAQIQDLALRAGVKIPREEILSQYVARPEIYKIVANRNSKTWGDLAGTWAADLKYWDKIQKIMVQYDEWAKDKTAPVDNAITWWKINQDDPSDVRGMNGAREVAWLKTEGSCRVLAENLLANLTTARTYRVGKFSTPPPGPTRDPKPSPTGKRVLLEPGHSESHPGARGLNPSVQEEDLNRYQAELLKANLESLGIQADIYDPLGDDLMEIGERAQDYDAFVSLHLNAYSKKEHYSCAMCHATRQKPDSKSAKVASEWAQAVASAIGNPCFSGTAGWPKGVMAVGLSVLNGASRTNCPIFFLSEAEFVDDEKEVGPIRARLVKAMEAGAKVLAKHL